MAHGILPAGGGADRQPQGAAQIDWSNPLARGLHIAAVPSGAGFRDAASGAVWTGVNAPTLATTSDGQAVKTVSGNSQYGYFPCYIRNAPLTMVHVSVLDSTAQAAICSLGTATGTERLVLFYGSSAGNYSASSAPNGGGTEPSVAAPAGALNVAGILFRTNTSPLEVFANGRLAEGTSIWIPSGLVRRFYISTRVSTVPGVFSSQRSSLSLLWNRALSAVEIREISANPWQLFRDDTSDLLIFDMGAGGGLTIQPPLLTNSNTLYSPSVTTGAVGITAPLLTNSSTVYAPTVSAGGGIVQAPLLTNTSDLFSPTLNPGAVQVAPPLLPSENAFFAPVVSAGGSVIQTPLLTNSSNVFAPTLAAGNVNIAPPVFSNVSVLFEPSVANTGPQTIVAGLFTNTSTLYAPSIGEVAPLTDAEMREMYEKVLAIYAALPSLLTVPKFLALK